MACSCRSHRARLEVLPKTRETRLIGDAATTVRTLVVLFPHVSTSEQGYEGFERRR